MAIIAKFKVTGCSLETYETVLRELDAAGVGAVPPGQTYHVCYGSRDNVQVIDVFDSQQELDDFGKTLVPILQKHGITAEAEVSDVFNILGPR
jgi:hypothetical protein